MTLIESGLHYCIAHGGIVDVDQQDCDFANDDTECVLAPLLYDPREAKA